MLGMPYLGHGVGLRTQHYQTVLEEQPAIDWFEVISENYMVAGGNPRASCARCASATRWSCRRVAVDRLDRCARRALLEELAALATRSSGLDLRHLCWTRSAAPVARSPAAALHRGGVAHVAERHPRVQDRLRRRILIENVSSYVTFTQSTMTEWES